MQEPSETQEGSFRVRIEPNCGMQLAGCFINLELSYKSLEAMEMTYNILEDTAIGLTNEQLEYLHWYIDSLKSQGDSPAQIIDQVKDYLG